MHLVQPRYMRNGRSRAMLSPRRHYSKTFRGFMKQRSVQNINNCVEISQPNAITCMTFLPEKVVHSSLLLTGDTLGTVKLYNISNDCNTTIPTSQIELRSTSSINKICVSRNDSTEFCVASDDSTLYCYDIRSSDGNLRELRRYDGHISYITDCKHGGPNADFFLSSSIDSTVRLWHHTMRDCVFNLKVRSSVNSACFVPNEPYHIITASDGSTSEYTPRTVSANSRDLSASVVHLWDIRNHATYMSVIRQEPQTPSTAGSYFDYDSDSNENDLSFGFSSGWSSNSDSQSSTFSSQSSTNSKKREQMKPTATFHDVNQDTRRHYDQSFATYRQRFTGHHPSKRIYHVECDQITGRYLMTSGTDQQHKLWDIEGRNGICTYNVDHDPLNFTTQDDIFDAPILPAWNSEHQIMVCGSNQNGSVYIWHTDMRPELATETFGNYASKLTLFGSDVATVRAVALSDQCQYLAASDDRGNLKIVDLMGDYHEDVVQEKKKRVENPMIIARNNDDNDMIILDENYVNVSTDSVVCLEDLPAKKVNIKNSRKRQSVVEISDDSEDDRRKSKTVIRSRKNKSSKRRRLNESQKNKF
jgi:hypothetical protein